ncbi:MAG: CinA family protein [Propionibacteriaceae bacterium]|nr:CinA family protein [Propionibacteriaceae bacterium]
MAAQVIARLAAERLTLATSESLTGGLIGAALTSVPGASQVYLGGVIGYATTMKARLSGADWDVLDSHGAVSVEAVTAMAKGVRQSTGADWTVAVTGVAGPTEQEGHPPGTVWIAAAGARICRARRFSFAGDRAEVREQTVAAALELLLAELDRD